MRLFYYTYDIEGCIGEGYVVDCFGSTICLGQIEDSKIYEDNQLLNCSVETYLADETITDWVEL